MAQLSDTDLYYCSVANLLNLSDRSLWLLSIIDSTQYVDGNTRLQKYGLLTNKITLKGESVYDDWKSNHFGAFSQQLVADTEYFVDNGLIDAYIIQHYYGEKHFRYSITEKGKEILSTFKETHAPLIKMIKTITNYYFNKQLNELLVDAYALFPEYTDKSKIKALVRKTLLERDSELSSSYELPFTNTKIDLTSITSTAKVNPFLYNDEDFRQQLAEKSGLSKIPPLDIQAYDELSDIFADKKFLADVDLEEMMEEIRV